MIFCPECGVETSEWPRSVDLGPHGILELRILICRQECGWITVHDWKLVQQREMHFENKEEVR